MKPKTKLQKLLVEVQKKLPTLSDEKLEWAKKHCLEHKAVRLKSGKTTCLDCSHEWVERTQLINLIEIECPGCGVKLKIENTRTKKHIDGAYFNVIEAFEKYQVIRMFLIRGRYYSGKPADIYCLEVGQLWLTPDGKYEAFGHFQTGYFFTDNWSGPFELRNRVDLYNFKPFKTYPKIKAIPELKRNGFKNSLYDTRPLDLFLSLITNPKIETLFKAKQYDLVSHFVNNLSTWRWNKLDEYWPSIKICIRNKFIIKHPDMWIDYLDLLSGLNKDLRNMKYLAPTDLMKEHNKCVEKVNRIRAKEDYEKQKSQIHKNQLQYEKDKKAFFGIAFTSEDIHIRVLEHIKEFLNEYYYHGHCVFTNEYYKRKTSLILSAFVDGVPTETIEVSLKDFTIIQGRGKGNQPTPYHNKIIALIKSNMNEIMKAAKLQKELDKTYSLESDSLIEKANVA